MCVAILCISRTASAYEFKVDGIYYNITNTLEQTVSVTFESKSFNSYKGEIAIPLKVKFNNQTYSVTSIGTSAFRNCSGLTSVTIPNSVTSIESFAFSHCSGLTSVNIPNSVKSIGDCAFLGCSGLTSVTIGSSVTSIGMRTFGGCRNLKKFEVDTANDTYCAINGVLFSKSHKSIICYPCGKSDPGYTIPASVTSIGFEAFCDCIGLSSIIIPKSVTSIKNDAFSGCSGLIKCAYPSTISNPFGESIFSFAYDPNDAIIEDGLIYGREKSSILFASISLSGKYIIPNSVTSIGNHAFYGCSGLTSVTIPNSITSIGSSAFIGCSGLTSVIIGNSVTSIGDAAFYGCSGLTSVNIPNSITSIGSSAFSGCSGLSSVNIPNSVTSIGDAAFSGCSGLSSVNIPNSVTSIGDAAFGGCSGLTSVTIPNSITSIEGYAFRDCSGLTSVTIPNSVTSIESFAFYGCSGLTSITIGNSVTEIGMYAFYGCYDLEDVIVQATRAPLIHDNTFDGLHNQAMLSVPKNSIESYLASNWTFFNSLKIIGEEGCIKSYSDGMLSYYLLPSESGAERKTAFVKKGNYNSMTSVVIPERFRDDNSNRYYVTGIGCNAFNGCSALREVRFKTRCRISTIGDNAFKGTSITSIELPSCVSSIGKSAFADCTSLASVTLGNSIESIAESTFENCKLPEIVLPPSVKTVESFAFNRNSGLNKIAMGYKVTSIGAYAFQLTNIDRIFITAQVPPEAPDRAFWRYDGKLYVQGNAAVNAYYDALTCWDRFEGNVMSEPKSLTIISPSSVEGKVDEQFTLTATLTPADVDLPYIFWRSTNPEKVYVDNKGTVTVLQDITDDEDVKIIAETLYYNGPVAEFSLNGSSSSVAGIDGNSGAKIDVFTLQGVLVLRNATHEQFDNLASGIYIVRSGKDVKKVVK